MSDLPIGLRQQALAERRRREVARIDDMTGKDTTVSGRHLISNLGEVLFRADFPVAFSKRPVPQFAGELDAGQSVVAGAFPRADAIVSEWVVTGKVDGGFDGYFVGAWIAATIYGGSTLQKLWLNYSFHGTALRSPVHVTENIDEEI